MAYDDSNVFAKILRGEIPCNKVYEDEHVLAFHDIQPQTRVHVLIIPKRPYVSFAEFSQQASEAEITGFFRVAGNLAKALAVEADGYRTLAKPGRQGPQEVQHSHLTHARRQPPRRINRPTQAWGGARPHIRMHNHPMAQTPRYPHPTP